MEQLLTTKQIAEKLQIAEITVYKWREKGMPYKQFGRTVRFDYDEVLEWINKKGE